MLRFRARVKAKKEVVALVVDGALLAGGFREEEGAPVGDAADDATGGEDDVAGCFGDSGCVLMGYTKRVRRCESAAYSLISFTPRPGRTWIDCQLCQSQVMGRSYDSNQLIEHYVVAVSSTCALKYNLGVSRREVEQSR